MQSLQGFFPTPISANAFSTLRSKSTWRIIGFSLNDKPQELGDLGNVGELRREESSGMSSSAISGFEMRTKSSFSDTIVTDGAVLF